MKSSEPRLSIAMVAACPLPSSRGTPVRIHWLANALVQRGHQVHVVAYHLGEGALVHEYALHRIRRVPTYRKLSPGPSLQKLLVVDPMLGIRLRGVLLERRFDLIHAHHFEGLLTALAARGRRPLPIIFDAHTLLESELPYYGPKLFQPVLRRLGRALDRTLPGRADHVIAVSEPIRAKLIDSGACQPSGVSVVETGVRLDLFPRQERVDSRAAPPILIYTGNLATYQGVDLMLKAFAQVASRSPNATLQIVTESRFDPYEPLAEALGVRDRVEVHQARFQEVPGFMARARVALNPRVQCDGLPQKLLNYMAAGMPIVSFAGSARGLIDRHNALVVSDGDIGAFAEAVCALLDDPALAARLGENARQHAGEASWDAAAAKVETVYQGVLS